MVEKRGYGDAQTLRIIYEVLNPVRILLVDWWTGNDQRIIYYTVRKLQREHETTKPDKAKTTKRQEKQKQYLCVRVCVFSSHSFWTSSSLDVPAGVTQEEGHIGGRSHRIFHPPSFCGACLNFSREKDSAFPFPRRP